LAATASSFEFVLLHHNRMKLLAASGIHDFALKDIFKPEQLRLRTILSAIINFAKFREDKIPAFTEYVQNTVLLN
jgi:kinetochore protein Nuf2